RRSSDLRKSTGRNSFQGLRRSRASDPRVSSPLPCSTVPRSPPSTPLSFSALLPHSPDRGPNSLAVTQESTMLQFVRSILDRDRSTIERINAMRRVFARLSDAELSATASKTETLSDWFALAALAASRVLGQEIYDVQLRGALALARGSIAEMQTGEGKTLAATPAISWFARERRGVHVMTVNDYLARRDAAWMGDIYRLLGLSVAFVQQGMTAAERRAAYAADITYATQNEIGFDFLRDRLAMRTSEQVHRDFNAAVIDEVDSILIDEARVPLVIAGGESNDHGLAWIADQIVRDLRRGVHFTVDAGGHNAALTDAGFHAVERALGCRNLFDDSNLPI